MHIRYNDTIDTCVTLRARQDVEERRRANTGCLRENIAQQGETVGNAKLEINTDRHAHASVHVLLIETEENDELNAHRMTFQHTRNACAKTHSFILPYFFLLLIYKKSFDTSDVESFLRSMTLFYTMYPYNYWMLLFLRIRTPDTWVHILPHFQYGMTHLASWTYCRVFFHDQSGDSDVT